LPNGRFAERTFCRMDILPNGQFDGEWTFCRTDSLTANGHFAENRYIFWTLKVRLHGQSFCDIKNNIIQHHSWMWFPRELWMYSMILELKFAYVVFIYACLFKIWRQNTFLTSAAQTSYQ
jgi:hypothetical protein